MSTLKPKLRHRARAFAIQALYQHTYNETAVGELQQQVMAAHMDTKTEWEWFKRITSGVFAHLDQCDGAIAPHLDRSWQEVSPIEKAILRLGAFELQQCIEVPFKVVIDEYVELATSYGGTDGNGFVNAILDQIAKTARAIEYSASDK